ncbi:hypothetical protein ACVPOY_07165 [Staphylococcus aureus]
MHATKGSEDKKLGTKKIDISKLKTVDYSVMEDLTIRPLKKNHKMIVIKFRVPKNKVMKISKVLQIQIKIKHKIIPLQIKITAHQ